MHAFGMVVLATLALALGAPAQQTIVVDASGGGQFTGIQAAIDAASAGDTILVRPGVYEWFYVDKGVRVLGDPGVTAGTSFGPNNAGSFAVRGLPAGESAVVRGIEPRSGVFGGILVRDSAGHVHIEGIRLATAMFVVNSQQVSLLRVGLTGGNEPASLDVQDSVVVATDCALSSGFGVSSPVPGLLCSNSDVIFAGGTSVGGQHVLVRGGPGVRLLSGKLTITGESTSISASIQALGAAPVSAIEVVGGTLVLAPSVTLLPNQGQPPIERTGGTVIERPVAATTASVDQQVLSVRLHAPGAQLAFLYASAPARPPVTMPFGELWIGVPNLRIDGGVVPPNGVRNPSFNLPVVPPGTTLALQWAIGRNGLLELSTPVVTTLDG